MRRYIFYMLLLASTAGCTKTLDQGESISQEESNAATAAILTNTNLLYSENFQGNTSLNTYVVKQVATSYGITVVTDPKKGVTKVARFELRDTDPLASSGTRAEIKFPRNSNLDRWYAYSIMYPSAGYEADNSPEIINQWHQGNSTSPSISLQTRYDRLLFEIKSNTSIRYKYDLGPLVKDKWFNYIIHIKHANTSKGLVEMWINGIKVFTRTGANSYDLINYEMPQWKLGIYKWDWNTGTTNVKKRILYYDNIKLGNELATYADMQSN